ncbi:hypothetical protein GCM10023258_31650 [Terrabacter aeriphilus]|uniref:DUF402 domain-containing protein n=2 Tax=Terrabacter aeriphilus TaxID=515662 RepID=A0ABP9JHT2_9MICO
MPPGGFEPGTPVAGRFTKWGGGRHWEWDGHYLGSDEHGHWWFAPAGTRCARPGVEFVEPSGWVSLAPHEGAYVAGFYPGHREISVYVDMTTEPVWRRREATGGPEWEVTMVDLDLDVVLTRDGHLFVDDEDEFDQHRVELGYPAEVVELAERWRDVVLAAVAAGDEPFGTVGHAWLRRAASGGPCGR